MDLSLQKLTQAFSIRQQISAFESRLSTLFGGSPSSGGGRRTRRRRSGGGRCPMSAVTRAKLAAAARARWAKRKGTAGSAAKTPVKKGGLTAAGRRKFSEAMRARWAARRKAGGGTPAKASGKKGGGLIVVGRRKLSEAMKARWAARRKAVGKK